MVFGRGRAEQDRVKKNDEGGRGEINIKERSKKQRSDISKRCHRSIETVSEQTHSDPLYYASKRPYTAGSGPTSQATGTKGDSWKEYQG